MSDEFSIDVAFTKRSDEQRLVGGYAYVSKAGGNLLFDRQGDSIEPEDLREAVHDFMKSGRTLGVMHIPGADGKPVAGGEIVEMAVLAGDFMPPGMPANTEGLWIVAKVNDDTVWNMVKSGDLRAFSIGGRGRREEVR
jgi:hypothetical protein